MGFDEYRQLRGEWEAARIERERLLPAVTEPMEADETITPIALTDELARAIDRERDAWDALVAFLRSQNGRS